MGMALISGLALWRKLHLLEGVIMVFQLLCKMYNIILRLVVVFRQLVSSSQLFYLKIMAEKSALSGSGLAKVMMAKVTGYCC